MFTIHKALCLISLLNECLHASGEKFDKYLPTQDDFEKGLYMFDIGQNDLAGAFYSKTLDQILASIPTILSEFQTGIKVGVTVSVSNVQCFTEINMNK